MASIWGIRTGPCGEGLRGSCVHPDEVRRLMFALHPTLSAPPTVLTRLSWSLSHSGASVWLWDLTHLSAHTCAAFFS